MSNINDFEIKNGILLEYKGNESEVVIPDSVTRISNEAFCGHASLTSVTIPKSVTWIGEKAFCYCTNLTSITIPASVDVLDSTTFNGCTSLSSITVDPNNTSYHSEGNCIIDTDSKKLVVGCKNSVIPDDGSVRSICNSAFFRCESLKNITIPDTITKIGNDAFSECTSLTNITIPDSVTRIGMNAFSGCTSLKSVKIDESEDLPGVIVGSLFSTTFPKKFVGDVLYIDCYAFENCINLTDVTIPDSETEIADGVFDGCPNLIIHAPVFSYPEEYAEENDIPFEAI